MRATQAIGVGMLGLLAGIGGVPLAESGHHGRAGVYIGDPSGGHCSRYPGRRKHWSTGHAKATNANQRVAKKRRAKERGAHERTLRKLRSAARKGGAKIKGVRFIEVPA